MANVKKIVAGKRKPGRPPKYKTEAEKEKRRQEIALYKKEYHRKHYRKIRNEREKEERRNNPEKFRRKYKKYYDNNKEKISKKRKTEEYRAAMTGYNYKHRISNKIKQLFTNEALQKLLAEEFQKYLAQPAKLTDEATLAKIETALKSVAAVQAENAEIRKDLEMLCEDISKIEKQVKWGAK